MAEVVINDKVKTHEEGKHTYIGKYKGKDFKASMQDMNDERELVYMEGEENFTDDDKVVNADNEDTFLKLVKGITSKGFVRSNYKDKLVDLSNIRINLKSNK